MLSTLELSKLLQAHTASHLLERTFRVSRYSTFLKIVISRTWLW